MKFLMDATISPISVSLQPGRHLSVDSRPETAASTYQDEVSAFTPEFPHLIPMENGAFKQVSHYVTSPFKHWRQRKYKDPRTVYDVGSPLKDNILHSISLYKNAKYIPDESTKQGYTYHSRIRQGRLLPLLGAPAVKGPKINQCIGITPSGRSRSSTNRQHTLSKNSNHAKRQSHTTRLSKKPQMHHTSLTSVNSSIH
ncbi:uncharacterized protein LOC135694216 [Rhopilema esculentum]|uniref:uncharacterized protein LOC135694216 n=1 Tax=Rhopilema esculentum TaxID=499914 RepID=UPI0031DE4067